jgi:hypothetical protein
MAGEALMKIRIADGKGIIILPPFFIVILDRKAVLQNMIYIAGNFWIPQENISCLVL